MCIRDSDGSPGRTTEVLSGDFYTQLSTSTPHQIWSSAMVISPILRGMMGLEVNALKNVVTFAPHVPAGWSDFAIRHVQVGSAQLDLVYHAVGDDITLEVTRRGSGSVTLAFSPALSLRAKVLTAEINGAKVSPKLDANDLDQHATVIEPLTAERNTIHLRVSDNFAIGYPYTPPADGAANSNLKIVSEEWNPSHDELQLHLEGISGMNYELPIFNMPAPIESHGALIEERPSGKVLLIQFRKGPPDTYIPLILTLKFPSNHGQ